MVVTSINELRPAVRRAVIVNVETKTLSTLSLLSVLRHVGIPALVLECDSKDGSLEWFTHLMESYDFDLLVTRRQRHGLILDWLFRSIQSEEVLLVDSDAEVLESDYPQEMFRWSMDERVFGAGFIHGPEWLTALQTGFSHERLGLYQERPWIPFTLLKTKYIRAALEAGKTFDFHWIYNDFPLVPRLSRWLFSRFKKRSLENMRLSSLSVFRREYFFNKPSYVICDTGADVYTYLKYERFLLYAGIPAGLHTAYVAHFHGATRAVLGEKSNVADLGEVLPIVENRLLEKYGVVVPPQRV